MGRAATSSSEHQQGKLLRYFSSLLHQFHIRLKLANLVCGILPNFTSGLMRHRMYRMIGLKIAPGAMIMGNLDLVSGQPGMYDRLVIGAGVVIGDHVTFNLDAHVCIGDSVTVGPHALIYTGTHQIGPGSRRCVGDVLARPVTIEAGSWIGLGALILPGVTVGHGSIVAAGAVLAESVPPNSYVEGNPARVIRTLPWGNR